MILNHNLVNKIFYKSWLERVKEINRQYFCNYVYHEDRNILFYNPYVRHRSDLSSWSQEKIETLMSCQKIYILGDKTYEGDMFKVINFKKYIDKICEIRIYTEMVVRSDYMYKLPKRYYYSSGLISSKGYKN